MAIKDDFIMTIEDDEDIPVDQGIRESKSSPEPKKSQPKGKKKRSKSTPAESDKPNDLEDDQFESEFTFAFDGDRSIIKDNVPGFSVESNLLKRKQGDEPARVSIDDIISRKRKQVKKAKGGKEETKPEDEEMVPSNQDDMQVEAEEDDPMELGDDSAPDTDEVSEAESGDSEDSEDDEEDDAVDDEEEKRKNEYFAAPEEIDNTIHQSFSSLNLSRPIMKGLASLGFVKPTEIQSRTIPIALQGKDICGGAVTGSGKTAAFFVPILERLFYRPRQSACTRVLILCPTRELAVQVHNVGVKLAAFTDITFCLCVGGLKLKQQEVQLRAKPDVIVATPGRLIDHVRNCTGFSLDTCEILVMDEADRMLEDGFADELGEIVKTCPKTRQTMLFSATMTDNVDQLIRMSLNHPVRLFVDPSHQAASRLVQEFVRVRSRKEEDRAPILMALCRKAFKSKVIIFFRSKKAAHQMKICFGLMGLNSAELHGDLTQEQRLEALEQFRDHKVDYLHATDLAARGLDIKGVETVINYNMPMQFAQYLHRVGRTARAGRNGRAVTLIGENDRKMLKMAIKSATTPVKNRVVPPELVAKYAQKLESLKKNIEEVLEEEKQERAIRQAEMEVRKGENVLKHGAEIYSRPARTWFQNKNEKTQKNQKPKKSK